MLVVGLSAAGISADVVQVGALDVSSFKPKARAGCGK